MKKLLTMILSAVCLFMSVSFVGCANPSDSINEFDKYVVFCEDFSGETYTVASPYQDVTITVAYHEERELRFSYTIYYQENDAYTGENGDYYEVIYANKPGTYKRTASTRGEQGTDYYTLIIIVEKEILIEPEFYFEPNGAIDYTEGEKYTYLYDGKDHFPILHIIYDEQELEMDERMFFVVDKNGENYRYSNPWEIGVYTVRYIYYPKDKDGISFDRVFVDIVVEIIETSDKSVISISPEIESQFDLTDEKIWWNSNTSIDFEDDKIVIIFKKTTTYPELSIEDFNYENAESIRYMFLRPTSGQYGNAENYRQIAVINLKEKGRDRVIEAVLYFERISIIRCAQPNYIYGIEED